MSKISFSRIMPFVLIIALTILLSLSSLAENDNIVWIDHNKNNIMDPYEDPSLDIDDRAADLLSRMTLIEKARQLSQLNGGQTLFINGRFSKELSRKRILNPVVGSIYGFDRLTFRTSGEAAQAANDIQRMALENTNLGIPVLMGEECLHGHTAYDSTSYPQAIGLASSWNEELVYKTGRSIAEEVRSTGGHQVYSPVLGVARDPRWGRTEETFGEDPYLVSRLGVNMIKGLQGDSLKNSDSVMATAKHFLAHSNPQGGRNRAPIDISERTLRQVYLPPFASAVEEAGVGSIMPSYNEINGIPSHGNKTLLTDLLRGELGFDGYIISDWGGIGELQNKHRVAATYKEAVEQAINAGNDMRMLGTNDDGNYIGIIMELVQEGRITEERLDEAVTLILKSKFRLGLFENPYVDPELAADISGSEKHRKEALAAARETIVLLKNDYNLLPISKDLKSIAVIGPNADAPYNLLGDYKGFPPGGLETIVTPLEGIRNILGDNVVINYAKGTDLMNSGQEKDNVHRSIEEAAKVAADSDIAVVFVGEKSGMGISDISGESRDRAELGLPGYQLDLVKAVQETGTPTVVVLINGRPLAIPEIARDIPAILEAWYPGQEGGTAIADILFGDYNPDARLPVTFPRTVGQLPLTYDHKPGADQSSWHTDYVDVSHTPLFEFGYGLSYTEYKYSNLKVKMTSGKNISVSVDVKNTGQRAGNEVVQLYINDVISTVTTPVKELKGFRKVGLKPGETKTVHFTITSDQLTLIDRSGKKVVEPGEFEIQIGRSSANIVVKDSILY